MSKILMTYSNSHERLCNEYLDIYKNSLIFDKDRKSIYTQGEEFGYISSIHIGDEENLNTPSTLYNNPETNKYKFNQQVISNIHFDRENGLTYTYSDLRTDETTQSVNMENNIISVSIINGALVLEKYTPVTINNIRLMNGSDQINEYTEPNSISPIEINTDITYTTIDIEVSNETKTCAVQIDNSIVGPAYDGFHTNATAITETGQYLAQWEIEDTEKYTYIDLIDGIIKHKDDNTLCEVTVAVQDMHETLTNPPSISQASIKIGWFYRMYFGHTNYNGTEDFTPYIGNYSKDGSVTNSDISNNKFSFIYVQNIQGSVKEYNSDDNYIINLSANETGDTRELYILIPTAISMSSDMRFLWNNDMYETPNEANYNREPYYVINGIHYNKYILDGNYTVSTCPNMQITGFSSI